MTKRAEEIIQDIKLLESEKNYIHSLVALLMSEANMIDKEITGFTYTVIGINEKLRDLKAELSDTI